MSPVQAQSLIGRTVQDRFITAMHVEGPQGALRVWLIDEHHVRFWDVTDVEYSADLASDA